MTIRRAGLYLFVLSTSALLACGGDGGTGPTDTNGTCEGSLALAPGGSQAFSPSNTGDCQLFIPSGPGHRYRVGVLWATSASSTAASSVDLTVTRQSGASSPPTPGPESSSAPGFGVESGPIVPGDIIRSELERLEATERAHASVREWERGLISRLGSDALLRGGSSLAGQAGASAAAAPESRDFVAPFQGCSTDDAAYELIRGKLVLETTHLVAYQDSVQRESSPVDSASIRRMSDYYAAYGSFVIDNYFGGVSDIDQNGKIVVFVTPIPEDISEDAAALVLARDLFNSTECAASNEAEMTYFAANVIQAMEGSSPSFQALSTFVHEVKHISSLYNRIQADIGAHPTWIEEGTADIAAEVSSRLAWADSGGPAVNETMTRSSFPSGSSFNAANWGVLLRLARLTNTLSSQPNALTDDPTSAEPGHTFYGSSWHFHRFLGDAYYGGMLQDSAFFRRQNTSTAAVGVQFLESELGTSLQELEEELVIATMANGTPSEGSVSRTFSGYVFPSAAEIFCVPNPLGVYPWTVTTSGSQDTGGCTEGFDPNEETQDPSAAFVDATYSGSVGAGGMRIHDFESDGSGEGIDVEVSIVSVPSGEARVVVFRVQ